MSDVEVLFQKGSIPQERQDTYASIYGCYLGDVYRVQHGATWGILTWKGDTCWGLETTNKAITFWPELRVLKRLTEGDSENVWHYYQALLAQDGHPCDHLSRE
ncbi:MAG: hypothetical protein H2057_01430 [Alphaproteobacteria bacterium]|nr:hypothetical protein [Alphaproteobacteria bacterium]